MNEHAEQCAIFEWCAWNKSRFPDLGMLFAIPNGAKLPYKGRGKKRISPEAIRLKKEGMKPGVPDMFLPVSRGGFHGLFIELKVGKNQPSEAQLEMIDSLRDQGYLVRVVWGKDAAIRLICEYLGIKGDPYELDREQPEPDQSPSEPCPFCYLECVHQCDFSLDNSLETLVDEIKRLRNH